jgi:hypothetical protein
MVAVTAERREMMVKIAALREMRLTAMAVAAVVTMTVVTLVVATMMVMMELRVTAAAARAAVMA